AIELGDMCVRSVVDPAIERRHGSDSVHHSALGTAGRETLETTGVEVERVEQACLCPARDRVHGDADAALPQLAHDCAKRLVTAAGRWAFEFVEDGEVGVVE